MFTSQPSTAQAIERMIDRTPVVDPHTRIRCDRPNVPDLAALTEYHPVRAELDSVGMPAADVDPALPPDERVRRSIPYLRRMRNTTTAWCFYRILRDLYDFTDPHLTELNYREVFDRVAATGRDPAWARSVLKDRANIRTIVTSLRNRGADPSAEPADVHFMLDAHDLFCPGVATDLEPSFVGRTTRTEYYEAIAHVLGERPASTERLGRLLHEWLDRTVTGRVRFTSTFLPIEQRFEAPDESHAQFVLGQMADDWDVSDRDVDALARFVTWKVLDWHHENRKAIQIAVGAEFSIGDGKSLPRFRESWTSEMARVFRRFSGARFDLMMASDVLTHEVAVLARQFPNVFAAGYWGHNFIPATIERIVGLQLQLAPMTKFTGFLSDAPDVEWAYGKLQVVKKAMAAALARLVEAGFSEESEIPPLLQQILHDTPRDLYGLGPEPAAP